MSATKVRYGDEGDFSLEACLKKLIKLLQGNYRLSRRAMALLLLQEDEEIQDLVRRKEPEIWKDVQEIVSRAKRTYSHPLNYLITMQRQETAEQILMRVREPNKVERVAFREKLSRIMMHPLAGLPILFIAIYYGFYKFVGVFAAQKLVNLLEVTFFGEKISPWVREVFPKLVPYPIVQKLFIGEYGILTQAIPYAVALILPIVAAFSLVFALFEDVGYLPRLAMLLDRLFKKIGLSGRAVIPMVLGFGCDTMATMVTRTLETRRERTISTLLLAFAIPCSAQLGVILGLLSQKPKALLIWGIVVTLEFLFIGYLASKIIPGESPRFFMEIPPLRMPRISNVLVKTYSRVIWYFKEVFPLFILASILIWIGQLTNVFQMAIRLLEPLVRLLGLPKETAVAFLFGFFRRDYGVAGLFDMAREGIFSGVQLVVVTVTLTLFVPCIAQFIMTIKERGMKTAIAISLFVFPTAFLMGFILNLVLVFLGVKL